MHLDWPETDTRGFGNAYGYRSMVAALRRTGLFPHDPASPLALRVIAPPFYAPVPGKRNLLLTMYESPDLPAEAIRRVRLADALIVPSTFNVRIFRRVFDGPIHCLPLGVDAPSTIPTRTFATPFRWLFVGANNVRKGWPVLGVTWDRYFAGMTGVELYFKTTPMVPGMSGVVTRHGALVFDERNLPRADLDALYASAHAFVYPTLGEGWGLTLLESFAWGLPCVATDYGGHLDFADRRACMLVPATLKRLVTSEEARAETPDGRSAWATLHPARLAAAMLRVMQDYENALAMGRRAAKVARRFPWGRAQARLAAILAREAQMAQARAA
jgi:glycosyltransferase involved in cell wall biosynthesis